MTNQSHQARDISFNFTGRTFLVTGAASGIGKAVASRLLDSNANVYGLDLMELDKSTLSCDPSRVSNLKFFRGDICAEDVWQAATQDILNSGGALDGLVNCAGLLYVEKIDKLSRATFDKTFAVNVFGTMLGVQQCIPCMEKSDCATVVNFASISALVGSSYSSIYAATKGAMAAYTRALANELSSKTNPIRGVCISPGVIVTDMTEKNWPIWKELYGYESEEAMRMATIDRQLTKRNGNVTDISTLVSFLLSRDSNFINGANIVIDGGYSI
jgi:NAD(P)-dependent dehydrogenase (short-subunit alcohol dehydrogenase family)